MINGFWVSQALYVAATLGLADLLRDGRKTVDELANAVSAHAPSLHRLLRVLASVGVFAEDTDGRFGLTPLAEYLRTDVAGSHRAWAIWSGQPSTWAMWGELLHCTRSGEAGFSKAYGKSIWEYYAEHPDQNAIFNAAMTGTSRVVTQAIVRSANLSSSTTVVDVGGGQGALIAAALESHPAMRGILFDQPHVVAGARELLEAAGVASRCELIAGNFFESVPERGDTYLLKSMLQDWDDPHAVAILRNCRRAMEAGARLLVIERVIPPGNDFHPSKLGDLLMLVMYGGRVRSEREFTQLYADAGFNLKSTTAIAEGAGLSIIEGSLV
jgi:ubiquinone/menaquinone biosynthesis C-methylase UbiE